MVLILFLMNRSDFDLISGIEKQRKPLFDLLEEGPR
jgi:hypothetical protein